MEHRRLDGRSHRRSVELHRTSSPYYQSNRWGCCAQNSGMELGNQDLGLELDYQDSNRRLDCHKIRVEIPNKDCVCQCDLEAGEMDLVEHRMATD